MSERADRIDRQGEKEGDDGCRWKVMARLETATHTRSLTQEKNSKLDILTEECVIHLYNI